MLSLTFLLTSLVIVATPGTGAIYTIATGLGRGMRAGVIAAFGCTLGIVPHLLAAVTGAAALLAASGQAFAAFKVLGVAYLLYLAVAVWRDRTLLTAERAPDRLSARRIISSAVLINLLNPKLTLFFFAFLPQFVQRDGGSALPTMLLLSGVFMAMTFVVFCVYGLLASTLRTRVIARPRVLGGLRRVFAVSFLGLGLRLATTDR